MKPKLARFSKAHAFSCPICKNDLILQENCFQCCNRHSFDLAKSGYVNLAPQAKQSKEYDKDNFQHRQTVLETGLYQHILDAVIQKISTYPCKTILDAGCGEGYYARNIQAQFVDKTIYAFDLSKDSIQLASKKDSSLAVQWFVGDLAKLPLKDKSIDILLDIFAPAHYQEFQRVLTDTGILIKVVPTDQHLIEIRKQVAKENYSNQDIVKHFANSFEILEQTSIQATYPINGASKEALLKMTPLLFHVKETDWSSLEEITIAATILVGKKRD